MKNHSCGFALISAIFLLVVIAALGLFALSISNTQQHSSVMDALGSRAYQAAKTGIEWGTYQISKGGVTSCTSFPQPTMPPGTQLSSFTVTVECTLSPQYTEGVSTFYVYRLKSIATTGTVGSANYFERQIQIAIKQP